MPRTSGAGADASGANVSGYSQTDPVIGSGAGDA